MIRPATLADWPAVDEMLRRMQAETGHAYHSGTACMSFRRCLRDGFAVVVDQGGPVGVMLAVAGQSWCSQEWHARDLVMWVDPAARGRWARPMIAAFRGWCREIGAIGTISIPGRRGARCTETIYEVT